MELMQEIQRLLKMCNEKHDSSFSVQFDANECGFIIEYNQVIHRFNSFEYLLDQLKRYAGILD